MFSLKNGIALVLTRILILATVFIWIVYDVFIYSVSGNPSTISAVIIVWSNHMPGIPFAFGILMGHLFYQTHGPLEWPNNGSKL